jgi:hypothetical protein
MYRCWIDYHRDTRGCRFTLMTRDLMQGVVLQEGHNGMQEAIEWGVRRMRARGIDPETVYARVGYSDEDDENYHHLPDVFDENAFLVARLLLE